MQELEKILKEIKTEKKKHWDPADESDKIIGWCFDKCMDIVRNHLNDRWISVEECLPEKEYSTVLCVTDKNYYFVGVYNRKKRFRTGDIYAEGKVIAWMPLEPYQPERRDNHDGK